MATIEERPIEPNCFETDREEQWYKVGVYDGREEGATEQKAIDEAEIKELKAIVELTASVMGIGTKWFNDVARMDATMELRERIIKYYE